VCGRGGEDGGEGEGEGTGDEKQGDGRGEGRRCGRWEQRCSRRDALRDPALSYGREACAMPLRSHASTAAPWRTLAVAYPIARAPSHLSCHRGSLLEPR
jgi:hypothetical protein